MLHKVHRVSLKPACCESNSACRERNSHFNLVRESSKDDAVYCARIRAKVRGKPSTQVRFDNFFRNLFHEPSIPRDQPAKS